ncbi:right-handed parallel beta-helix repeat-containing protein, partial [Bacteroidota bacterium]
YTIGGATADFLTIADAFTAMNNCGINGPVIFNVNTGIYNEQLNISTINGMSSVNTVTFQSTTGNNADVTILYAATGTANNYVIKLDGANYWIFKNLTLKAAGASYGFVVDMTNGAHHNKIEGCKLDANATTTSSNFRAINLYGGSLNHHNTFLNNEVIGGYYGIYCYGANTTSLAKANVFEGNEIKDFYVYSAYNYYQDSLTFKNNIFTNRSSSGTAYGPRMYYCDGIQITGNKILLNSSGTQYGMYVYYCDSTANYRSMIANNMIITSAGTGVHYGIYYQYGNGCDFLYNSFYNSGGSASNYVFRVYNSSTSYSGHNIYNNSIHNAGGGYNIYVYNNSYLYGADNNNIYGPNANYFAYWGGNRTNLTALKAAYSNTNQNSISVNPQYLSASDLHSSSVYLDGGAQAFNNIINTDFDGTARDTLTPDIGADEFLLIPDDAGIFALVSPIGPCPGDTSDVIVSLRNFGTDTIFTAIINWAINDTIQTSVNFNDTLLVGQSENITLGQYVFQAGITYKLESWSSNPNGPADGNPSNDSLTVNSLETSFPSGTYTIGGATADYSTFGAAISALTSNGICGPVIFNINSGIYNEQISINSIIGTSSTNTITFQSATGNPQDVTIQYSALSSGDNFVVKLDNASYTTFKKITVKATGASYAYGVHLTNGSHHNTLDGNIIISNLTTSSNGRPVVLYIGGNNYNTIKNNVIEGGYYAMYIYGTSSTSWDKGNVIENNEIKNFYYYGMMVYYQDSVTVRSNYIHDQINTTCYGIYAYYIYNGYDISKNTINLNASSYSYGMRVYYANYNNTTTAWGLVSNNMISITGGTSTNYGIYSYYADRTRYLYNSVNLTSGSTSSRSLYQYNLTTHNVIFKNNNWVNTGGGYAVYMNTPTAISYSDYNNFYATGTYLAYWSGNRTTLSALQTASSKDVNSVSVNPQFLSSTDLHSSAVGIDGEALPDPLALTDIDGHARDTLAPDIGADEFMLLPDDAGIFALVSPTGPCPGDTSNVFVKLRNYGTDTLFTAIVNWAVNDTLQTSVNFNDTLLVGQTIDIFVGQYIFLQGINYKFESWSSNPNGPADGNPSNDTITIYPLKTAMPSGTYTIGGASADYQSIGSAISDLNTFGICGTVIFNINSGTYNEQIHLGNIVGTSAAHTITFQGVTADSTDVVIQFSASSTANNGVIFLDGAKYISFKHITLIASGTSYAYGVHITNGAEYNTIENCVITSNLTTSSNGRAVVIYGGANNQYNTIKNNVVTGGYYSMYIYGTNTTSRAKYNIIEGNDISGFYYYGMMLYYQDSIQVIGNYIHNGINTTQYGIYTYYVFDGFRIEGNKVILTPSSYAYGIRIYYCNYYSYISTNTAEGIVANNFISISTGSSTNYGFYNYYSNKVKYYYNSVNLSGGNTSSRALYQYNTTSNTYKEDYINNIFCNTSGGYAAYFSTPTGITTIDYNDYYATGTYLAYWSGNRNNLAALKTASGKDVHSISTDPLFFTPTDLHTTSSYLNDAATPIASVTLDIDSELRDTLTPDIGADEFLPPPYEAGIIEMSSPVDGCGLDTVFVTIDIENSGLDTINGNLNANYQIVGDTTVITEAVTTTILPGDTLTFTFATLADITALVDSNFCFIAWINLSGDPILYNDSANKCVNNGVVAPPPIAFGDTIAYGDSATLTAVSPNNLFWYPSLSSTTEIDTGSTFITPPLFDTTTYYVAAKVGVANALYTLGTGTTVNSGSTYPTPYGNWYWGNKDQYLILASELNTLGIVAGDILSIAFDVSAVNSCPNLLNYSISLGHTTQSSLTGWVSNLTTVLSLPSGYQPTVGWNTHQFTTPFTWDGNNNLVIQICSNNSNYLSNGNASVKQSSTAFTATRNVHADQAGVCSQTGSTAYSQRPNMQLFAGGSGGCPSTYVPVTAIVTGIPAGDLEVIDIQTAEGCGLDTNETLTIAIYNHGYGTINGGYSARFRVDNHPWMSPEAIPDTIGPNDTILYTFITGANLLAPSDTIFSITAVVNLTGDPYHPNDTLTKDSIESLYTPPNPVFTSPILITYGFTANLTVSSPDSIYWYTNFADSAELATGNTYITPPLYDTTTYWVQAGSMFGGAGANIAPLAVASASTCNTGPCSTLNDLNFGNCGTQSMWISTSSPPSSTPGVNYMDFTWTTPKVMDEMTIHHAQNNARSLTGATMQKWVGGNWVTFHTFSNLPQACINTVSFPLVVTTKLRLTAFQMTGSGQTSNPNFREIEIFEASLAGCTSDRLPFVVNTTAPPPI